MIASAKTTNASVAMNVRAAIASARTTLVIAKIAVATTALRRTAPARTATANKIIVTTSRDTVTPSTVLVYGPEDLVSFMIAIAEEGDRAVEIVERIKHIARTAEKLYVLK